MGEQSEAKTAKKSFESKDSGSFFDVKLRSELFRFATVRTFNPNSNNPLIGYFLRKGQLHFEHFFHKIFLLKI